MPQNDTRMIAVIAIAIVVLLFGGAWWFSRTTTPPANATPQAVTATDAPIEKAPEPPVNLPPRDQMDAFLRPLLQALSSRPELANWLATDDLIGQLASAINQAAGGNSPARDFKVVAPTSSFAVAGRGEARTIDPRSYRRYDGLVQTVTSIDASAVARVYKTIRPRLNEAYQSLGHPNGDVDRALAQAIDILIDTPDVKDPIRVIEGGGAGWLYENDELEGLDSTQKQLLRMGPQHADAVKVWLRALKNALN